MDITTVGVVAAVVTLAITLAKARQRRARLRLQVFPCRADGSLVRGSGGFSHLSCEVLNISPATVVLGGIGFSSRIRVAPEPGESATLTQELVQGEAPIELRPGYSFRFVVPLGRLLIELESIWAQATSGRRFQVSARQVLWVQEQLFQSYCVDHAA